MLNPHFVYLAVALSAVGALGYVRATLAGRAIPHRVTWSLWGVEGVLAFVAERQSHVGLAALMTLMLGLVPIAVVLVSFRGHHGSWAIDGFDVVCAAISVGGLVGWAVARDATVAIAAFVTADQVAALPTLRKAWRAPTSESGGVFLLGSLNCLITLLTLHRVTTAGVAFPGAIMISDILLSTLVMTRVGDRWRRRRAVSGERATSALP